MNLQRLSSLDWDLEIILFFAVLDKFESKNFVRFYGTGNRVAGVDFQKMKLLLLLLGKHIKQLSIDGDLFERTGKDRVLAEIYSIFIHLKTVFGCCYYEASARIDWDLNFSLFLLFFWVWNHHYI